MMATSADSAAVRRGELARILALVRLHLILAYRQLSGSSRSERVAGKAVLVLLMVWVAFFSFALGKIVYRVGQDLGPHTPEMQAVLVGFGLGFALLFAICGVFEKGMGGGIDLSRLFHLPVPTATMVGAGLTARFAAPHMLLPAGLVVGFPLVGVTSGHPWFAVAFVPATVLWLIHLNLILMAVSLITIGVRTSRRFVERAGLVGIIIFFIYISLMMTPAEAALDRAVASAVELGKAYWEAVYPLLLVLPGVSPLTWIHDGGRGVLVLLVALAEAAALFVFARRMIDRLAVMGATSTSSRQRARAVSRPSRPPLLDQLVRWPLLAKDLRMLVRDPTTRLEMVMLAALPLTLGLLFAGPGSPPGERLLHHLMPLAVLLMLKDRLSNHLCREVNGLLLILGSTVPRWRVLVEKNLATLVVLLLLMTVPAGLLVWHGASVVSIVLDYVFIVSVALPFVGVGNLLAILLPIPMISKKGQMTVNLPMPRLLLGEALQLLVFAVVGAFVVPLLLVHWVFVELAQPLGRSLLAASAMLAYGLGIYSLLLCWAASLFADNEPELYEKVIRSRG
jgi:hypothetical protein